MIDPLRSAPEAPLSGSRHTMWSALAAVHGAAALQVGVLTYEGEASARMDIPIATALSLAAVVAAGAAMSARWWQISGDGPSGIRWRVIARVADRALAVVMIVLALALATMALTSPVPLLVRIWLAGAAALAGAYGVPLARRAVHPAEQPDGGPGARPS